MVFRILVAIAMITLFISCEVASSIKDENHSSYDNRMNFASMGENTLPLTKQMGFVHSSLDYQIFNKEEYLSFYNFMNNEIVVYNYSTKEITDRILLEVDGPDGLGTLSPSTAHLMISKENFLVLNTSTFVMYLVNKESRVVRKYQLLDLKEDDFSAVPRPTSLNPIIKHGDNIYLSCAINTRRMNYEGYSTILRLNLKTGLADYIFELPEIYNERFWPMDFKHWVSMAYDHNQDRLILNYPVSHELYVGNFQGELLSRKYVGSDYIEEIKGWSDELTDGMERPTGEEFEKMTHFGFSNSDYASIKYDPYRKLFYRIVHVRPDLETVKSGYRIPKVSVMILSSEFEKLGEVLFDESMYNHSMIFVSKEGLNLARKDRYNQDEDSITFEVLMPQEFN